MTEREMDRLIDRIVDRACLEVKKYGRSDIDFLAIAERYKAFREATDKERDDVLWYARGVYKAVASMNPWKIGVDIRY